MDMSIIFLLQFFMFFLLVDIYFILTNLMEMEMVQLQLITHID